MKLSSAVAIVLVGLLAVATSRAADSPRAPHPAVVPAGASPRPDAPERPAARRRPAGVAAATHGTSGNVALGLLLILAAQSSGRR